MNEVIEIVEGMNLYTVHFCPFETEGEVEPMEALVTGVSYSQAEHKFHAKYRNFRILGIMWTGEVI